MPGPRTTPPLLISVFIHAVLLGSLAVIRFNLYDNQPVVTVQTVFAEERAQEEFSQDLQLDTTASESLNLTAGGVQSTELGAAPSSSAARSKIERAETLQQPEFRFDLADLQTPSLEILGEDLGEGEVSGEVGARVDGYGAAMARLTQELLRMMRGQQVIACWLFDESNSLKDDREEIRDQFDKIYQELNIANERAKRGRFQSLETMIYSFGESLHPITRKPTADLKQIREAIDNVPVDETGNENTFQAISTVIDEHGKAAARSDRKLVIILLTDEVGDDAEQLEEIISKAKRLKSPVFVLGREAVFGYPYAHVRWVNPDSGISHWIRVDRGPETAFPEALQYDGFRGRHDSYSSGFGPYAQVRLVRETGGIFFLLAGDEANLAGRSIGEGQQRKFDDVAMKEYEPLLLDKREYARRRDASEFRKTIWDTILRLNPHIDPQLVIRWHHYSIDPAEFQTEGKENFEKAKRAMGIINQQLAQLERVRPLRSLESEQRWRAAFDLLNAQLIACRVREFQYLLSMDKHAREQPEPQKPDTNYWDLAYSNEMLAPDEEQVKKTAVNVEELEAQRRHALELYDQVIRDHPDTPWAMIAAAERRLGFGMEFRERFWDPRYFEEVKKGVVPKF